MSTATRDAAESPQVARRRDWRFAAKALASPYSGTTILLVALVVYFAASSSEFLETSNILVILGAAAAIGIVAIGQTFVVVSGGFDLSVSGTAPLAAVVFGKIANEGSGIVPALIVALAVGAAVGLANGLMISRAGFNPLIATLGTASITGGLAFVVSKGLTVIYEDRATGFLAERSIGDIPNQVWVLLIVACITFIVLRYTTFGRSLYSLGGNWEASWLAGMRVNLLSTLVYVICGVTAALGGIVIASQLLAADGQLAGNYALLSIAAVILGGGSLTGGEGGVVGTVIGVLALGVLTNGMALLHVSSFYQEMATGGVLLLAVGLGRIRQLVNVA
jgi:ribose transport system permease protein